MLFRSLVVCHDQPALLQLLYDDVPLAFGDFFDLDIVSGAPGPVGDVLHGAGMVDVDDENVIESHFFHGFLSFYERDGARFAETVEVDFSHEKLLEVDNVQRLVAAALWY